ncbi:hypothetical protein QBC47DRAFT_460516 [Echria macrotheca]|uniref:Uncharacterized protein n=1 Tax=Echria macrotheca TaxID=438768 RepID=A0AAJ0BCW4_9PEZI|nr:hypothetical protein QBC47DRAFT_460516 [Echria macrotheca]
MSTHSPKYHDLHGPQAHTDDNTSQTDLDSDYQEEDGKLAWTDDTIRDTSHTSRRRARARRIRTAVSIFRGLFDTIILITIVYLLLERRNIQQHDMSASTEKEHEHQLGGDITGFAPRSTSVSQKIKKFSPNPSFIPTNLTSFFTPSTTQAWLSLVPRGLGYIHTQNTSHLHPPVPVPLAGYPPSTFTTSVTHQLHCLHAIIGVVAALATNDTSRLPPEGPWHVAHCFDYLRQSILCCGDVALEGQQTTFPDGFVGSDGWDSHHVCRDYDEVKEYLERNRAGDDLWI